MSLRTAAVTATGLLFGAVLALFAFALGGAGHGASLPVIAVWFPLILFGFAGFVLSPLIWATLAALSGARSRKPRRVFAIVALGQLAWLWWAPARIADDVERVGADTMLGFFAIYFAGHAALWIRFLRRAEAPTPVPPPAARTPPPAP